MTSLLLAAADLVAIAVLTFAVYLPRHRRTDLVPAFLGVNVGVLAVSLALSSGSATVGLGLGLFGVLSIIRLRSSEISHREIAYYFAALALGLLGGVGSADPVLTASLMGVVVLAMIVGDHPRIARWRRASRHQQVVLDQALSDPSTLVARLEAVTGATVVSAQVLRLDLVNDSTLVQVEYVPATGSPQVPSVVSEPRPAGEPAQLEGAVTR